MPSQTDLLNDALGQIGASPIVAIDDGTVAANWCATFYPALRRSMLRMSHWRFAETRAALAQDAATPAFEFQFSYALAANMIKLVEYNSVQLIINSPDVLLVPNVVFLAPYVGYFKIEGRHLLTNDAEVKIVYIADVTDPNIWDPLFYQVLATWLASKLAKAITKDSKKAATLIQEATQMWAPLALAVDGQEGSVIPYQSDDLIWGR